MIGGKLLQQNMNKLDNSQTKLEKVDFREIKIKNDEMKLNIIGELAKVINIDMKILKMTTTNRR